jgi:hypothetical protein
MEVAARMQAFEASASVANTGTGSRREGEAFERLTMEFWERLSLIAQANGASRVAARNDSAKRWWKLTIGPRSLFVPADPATPATTRQERWLETDYQVEELLAAFPTLPRAIANYAPHTGPFAQDRYPAMFEGLGTRFDGTIVLVEGDTLREKVLLECKCAKSSTGRQIDGNAHERLSFQIMQYLEVATRYTRCSFLVITNGAYVRYRNKYHVNFHVQADRLANFAWFSMEHLSEASRYLAWADEVNRWLVHGTPRRLQNHT